jgi:Tfp pilus assembly protein PilX
MNRSGFATPVALGLALLMALLAASALQDAGLARSLATTRLLHQRAFAAGEIGLAQVATELAPPGAPVPAPRRSTLAAHPTDSVETAVVETLADTLPNGHSAGRIVERHFEVRSTGWSARNTRVVQVEGLRRRDLVPPP